jgi:hypothetical protein
VVYAVRTCNGRTKNLKEPSNHVLTAFSEEKKIGRFVVFFFNINPYISNLTIGYGVFSFIFQFSSICTVAIVHYNQLTNKGRRKEDRKGRNQKSKN